MAPPTMPLCPPCRNSNLLRGPYMDWRACIFTELSREHRVDDYLRCASHALLSAKWSLSSSGIYNHEAALVQCITTVVCTITSTFTPKSLIARVPLFNSSIAMAFQSLWPFDRSMATYGIMSPRTFIQKGRRLGEEVCTQC